MNVPYTCEICGVECVGHPQSKYCPTCRDEVIRWTQRERQVKNRAKQRAEARKTGGRLTLGQIAARARALHMSYGEFVAKYGI